MSRNLSGNYALPVPQTPFIANTTISSDDVNDVMSDIATALTDSLDRQGRGAMTAPLIVPVATASLPSVAFTGDPDTGMYNAGANQLGFATGGTNRATLDSTSLTITAALRTGNGTVGAPAHSFGADTDTGFYRAGSADVRLAIDGADVVTVTPSTLTIAAALVAAGVTSSKGLVVTQSTTNGDGATITGNGTGPGLRVTGGASGAAIIAEAGGGNTSALVATPAGSGIGIDVQANGSGYGVVIQGNTTLAPLRIIPSSAPGGSIGIGSLYTDSSGFLYIWATSGGPGWVKVGSQS